MSVNQIMVVGQQLTLTVQGVDGEGNVIPAGTEISWTTSVGGIVELSATSPDGYETLVTAVAAGTVTVTVTNADLSLSQTFIIEVVVSTPVSLQITPGFAGVVNPPASGQEAGFGLGLGYGRTQP